MQMCDEFFQAKGKKQQMLKRKQVSIKNSGVIKEQRTSVE